MSRRLGVVIPKKVGKAVVRNLVKRRIREILRDGGDVFPAGTWAVVIVKPGVVKLTYRELREEILATFEKALNGEGR